MRSEPEPSQAFANVYEDAARAGAYAQLEFPGTYYLAYRDLPELIRRHVRGNRALDFGCGTGRSTRFLKGLGFEAIGADISEEMLALARSSEPGGDYRLIDGDSLGSLETLGFDLVLSVFTIDNVPMAEKAGWLASLRRALGPQGRFVNLVSAPEIYRHEWASFSTKGFQENGSATNGDRVRIVMLDVEDRRPVVDVLCPPEEYARLFEEAGLRVIETHKPLGRPDEPFQWVSETTISPWTIYVLAG